MNIPYEIFKNPVYKGDFRLGTACGHCEKCVWIKTQEKRDKFPRFRAWLKEYKMMVEVARLNYDGSIEVALSEEDDFSEFEDGEFELMQCIGLLAAKSYRGKRPEDKLVFAGDICRHTDDLSLFSVSWNPIKARFEITYCPDGEVLPVEEIECSLLEIIGTIHENPELLEG